jgi:glycosyltransferase involved in cell wall biosynthesis
VPRVSVIIPAYNRRDAIRPALDSVIAQTYADVEVILVDDGSTDNLVDLVRAEYPGVRTLTLERNSGVSAARNHGVAAARGELIAFLDSDDLWSPDKLTLQIEDFDRHQDAVLSFTDITIGATGTALVYSTSQPFQPERVFEQLLEGGPILPSAVIVRKRDVDKVGGFSPEVAVGEDRDLWLRLAALGRFRFLPLPLVRRVVYHDALSHRSERWKGDFDLVVTRFLERPEGQPYRNRERELRAFQLVKIGARHLRNGHVMDSCSALLRAVSSDPPAIVGSRGRRLLASALSSHLQRVVRWTRIRRLWRRVTRFATSPTKDPVHSSTLPLGYRPPPDAPRRVPSRH